MTVVANYSDLSPNMRNLLLDGAPNAERSTTHLKSLNALCDRGLAIHTDLRKAGHYRLTDRGVAAAAHLRSLDTPTTTAVATSAAFYDAVRHAFPALTDVARYVAQLRRWAAEPVADNDEWEKGRASAFTMIAGQLEEGVLGDMAPLLLPEAIRHDAEWNAAANVQED